MSYFDSVSDIAFMEDIEQSLEPMSSYSDDAKINYDFYGNASEEATAEESFVVRGDVTEEDFWDVNDDIHKTNKIQESDMFHESDVAVVEAEAIGTGMKAQDSSFDQSELVNWQKKGFENYLRNLLKSNENISPCKMEQ